MRVASRLIAVLVAAVLAIGFAACGNDDATSDSEVAVLKVSGGGSAQFREPGGDNSVQNFGREASKAELTQAATVLHSYLVARAEKDWESACSYLSEGKVRELEQLAAQSSKLEGKGCAATLGALAIGIPQAASVAATEVDAASLRVGGKMTFLLYHGAHNTDYFALMTNEDGAWKVDDTSPAAF
ncbi:MAG TPA: hypothetical protein VIE64_04180 [Solirubrobacterales bacterium]|jgi:hypothetical protein